MATRKRNLLLSRESDAPLSPNPSRFECCEESRDKRFQAIRDTLQIVSHGLLPVAHLILEYSDELNVMYAYRCVPAALGQVLPYHVMKHIAEFSAQQCHDCEECSMDVWMRCQSWCVWEWSDQKCNACMSDDPEFTHMCKLCVHLQACFLKFSTHIQY
jgi:hypothetical protein